MKKKEISSQKLLHATVKQAVQKRISSVGHSSIIPGIDINELKFSLDILKYALDYSEAIVDTVRLPLVVLNKKLQVLTANRSFYETFKLIPSKTENRLIYMLNKRAWDIPKLKILLEKILPANTQFDNYEVEIDFPHIGKRTFLLNARRTYRQVNNTEATLLAFEDITDLKHLEKQKDDFIGIISHELKTPLTSIKAYAQILGKHLNQNKDKKGQLYISKLNAYMERLNQLMASFVNVYKIQIGKLLLHKKNFIIDNLIKEAISDYQLTTKTHTIDYRSQVKISVHADYERIMQVMINLLSNAIKYSPSANKVIIETIKNHKYITISVKDFGLGIPLEDKRKVFDRFFRVSEKKENGIPGLGLGLYIASKIINQHKGKIWVDSALGKGSTFYFSLPI